MGTIGHVVDVFIHIFWWNKYMRVPSRGMSTLWRIYQETQLRVQHREGMFHSQTQTTTHINIEGCWLTCKNVGVRHVLGKSEVEARLWSRVPLVLFVSFEFNFSSFLFCSLRYRRTPILFYTAVSYPSFYSLFMRFLNNKSLFPVLPCVA